MRGFRNKPKKDAPVVFNLGELSKKLKTYAKAGAPLEVTVRAFEDGKVVGRKISRAK